MNVNLATVPTTFFPFHAVLQALRCDTATGATYCVGVSTRYWQWIYNMCSISSISIFIYLFLKTAVYLIKCGYLIILFLSNLLLHFIETNALVTFSHNKLAFSNWSCLISQNLTWEKLKYQNQKKKSKKQLERKKESTSLRNP